MAKKAAPMKMKKKKRTNAVKSARQQLFHKADILVIGFCLLTTLLSGLGLWFGTLDYKKASKEYQKLGEFVELRDVIAEGNLDLSDQTFQIDWASLRAINSEIIAWIVIPDTPVNYPVLQTQDNSKYLHTSFDGTSNICGAIFMNTYNHADFTDWNTVIYGHNMKNGSMFAVLNKYKNEDFFKEHQEIWVLTPYWERKYNIISVHEAQDGSETYAIEFPDGSYEQHIASEVSQSLYDTGNSYNVAIPMVTLSTCTGRGKLDRMVLICQPVYETKLNPFVENRTVSGD